MRILAVALAAALALYTGLAIAHAPLFVSTSLASAGAISIYPFDLVLGLALLALLANEAFRFRLDPVASNRTVILLCLAYLGYQLFVVVPAAVLLHGMGPIDTVRAIEARFGLLLVLAVYLVVLKYSRVELLVALMDIAAAAVALYAVYLYARGEGVGGYAAGRFSVRVIWGGSSLLFGWLFFTSLFFWPLRWWRFALAVLAIGGIVLANHRSGFIALLAAFVVQMAAMGRITRRVVLTVGVIAVVAGGVYFAAPSVRESAAYSLSTMFNPQADTNAQDRVVRSRLGLEYFVQNPLGDYIWNHRYYLVNVTYDFAPHNFIVQMLTIQGAIASFFYFAVMAVALWIGWNNRRDARTAVMLAYLTFYLVFCLFNTNIDQYENQALFAIAVALLMYQNRLLRQNRAVARTRSAISAEPHAPAAPTTAPPGA